MRIGELFKTWRVNGSRQFAEMFGGMLFGGARCGVLTALTYGPNIAVDASLGNDFVVTITDNVAFVTDNPTNAPPSGFCQDISITYRNASGGAHGAGTFGALFKTQATAFPAIATGQSRTIFFRWNGTNWVEQVRTAADVAN